MTRKTTAPNATAADIARIHALARSFPGLADAPGVDPWDDALDRWAAGRFAAEFVLRVWDCWDLTRQCPLPFDLVFAWFVWDQERRAAFRAWADDPFWLGDHGWQEGRSPRQDDSQVPEGHDR